METHCNRGPTSGGSLLLSIDIQGYTGVMYGLMKHIMETTSFVV